MSEHDVDEVVERVTDATWADGAPVSPRQVRVILTALRPGDRLPGGLRVAAGKVVRHPLKAGTRLPGGLVVVRIEDLPAISEFHKP